MSLTAGSGPGRAPVVSGVTAAANVRPAGLETPPDGRRGVRWPARAGRAVRRVRRHWMLTVLLTAGLALRVVTQVAYTPALLYIDSPKYLVTGLARSDPEGYRALLVPLLWVGNLATVAAVQHALGLAMAITLYTLLTRRGTPRWTAALATAPLLLDAYQLQLEQTIMPDVMFETLILTGLTLLLWNPRPTPWMITGGAVLLGATADVRQIGEVLIVPVVVFALVAVRGRGPRLAAAGLAAASFVIPVLMYMTYSATVLADGFKLSDQGDAILYGRVAAAADCATLRLPAAERPLCPAPRVVAALGIDGLVNDPASPIYSYVPPAPVSPHTAVERFSRSVIEQQPLRIAGAIARDSVKLFALTRDTEPGDMPISRWQFQTAYPLFPPDVGDAYARALIAGNGGGGAPAVVRPLAEFLRAYQLHGGYTPGPFLLLALLAGLAGAVAGRRRGPAAALGCLMLTVTGIAVLLGADIYEFSWRYQLPALVLLPMAGAMALARGDGPPEPPATPRGGNSPAHRPVAGTRPGSPGRLDRLAVTRVHFPPSRPVSGRDERQ